MNIDWLYGLVDLSLPGYVAVTAIMVQTTVMAVTVYLHRDATHRSVDLHPVLRHFFRFWIWMTSSMLTREWVAVHRKHHVFADQRGDPHSPVIAGLRRILLEGAEFYYREARNPDTLQRYGKATPHDWIERRIYSRHRNAGIVLFVVAGLLLFGVPGIVMIAVQMLAMPVLAAGVINGFGHSVGYRNYEIENASTNILPWGLFVGGEELHNNHHAFPSSAKFSTRPWEFDAGWLCIVLLRSVGLATVRRRAPRFSIGDERQADPDATYAAIRSRVHVLRSYAVQVVTPVLRRELSGRSSLPPITQVRRLLTRSPVLLDAISQLQLTRLLEDHPVLRVIHDRQEQLRQLWETVSPARGDVSRMFSAWCARAEESGVEALREFACSLRRCSLVADAGAGAVRASSPAFSSG